MDLDRIQRTERVFGTVGILFVATFGFLYLDGSIQSRAALKEFRAESPQAGTTAPSETERPRSLDAAAEPAGSVRRTAALRTKSWPSKLLHSHSAIAELKIPRIGLDIPVFPNTSSANLNRGAGWIAGTATPIDPDGTVGIAGHRDRFFRSLRQILKNDEILLVTRARTETFVVDGIAIVTPENISMLSGGPRRSLVLVTCYPFSYVGRAPKRFIIRAELEHEVQTNQRSGSERRVSRDRTTNSALGGTE